MPVDISLSQRAGAFRGYFFYSKSHRHVQFKSSVLKIPELANTS